MIDTLQIYEELSQALEEAAARKLASILGAMYEELRNTATRAEFNELRAVIRELAEAQTRTEQRIEELTEAQRRTEQRVEELAEAQRRTEQRVEELAQAQKRTEEAVFRLARRLDDTDKQLGGLAATVGYTLENEAYRYLPRLLERDFGVLVEEPLYRDFLRDLKGQDVEVNILGRARRDSEPILIIGESKAQLSKRDVDMFLRKRVDRLDTGGLRPFPVLIAHMVTQRGTVEYAQEKGVAIYLSYQFQS